MAKRAEAALLSDPRRPIPRLARHRGRVKDEILAYNLFIVAVGIAVTWLSMTVRLARWRPVRGRWGGLGGLGLHRVLD
jgi:hypothetical protein